LAPRRTARRIAPAAAGSAALGCGAVLALAYALTWHPAIAPTEAPPRPEPQAVRAGARLAALGSCAACHTAEGGRPYAGGRPIATPFGTIHATNITPDPETGLGRWSLAAFTRAMREGVGRDGRQLYPAFPYTHYTGLTDGDVGALYAYVMSRTPVVATAQPNTLPFPFNLRPLIAGWNLLFFRSARFAPQPGRDAEWNRGAYIAEALGHCGACHSPRNGLGAEVAGRAYEGGEADGWHAPALGARSPAAPPWTAADLARYLAGWDPGHGGPAGPMRAVVDGYGGVPPAELAALARYVAELGRPAAGGAPVDRAVPDADPALARGATIYAGACAACHDSGGWAAGGVPYTTASLGRRSSVTGPDPRNLIHVLRDGIAPRAHDAGPIMPAFGDTLTAGQVADLAAYLRARFSEAGPWPDLTETVHRLIPDAPMPSAAGRSSARAEARP
jgi:mono/diheme cytochrome c family protein